MKVALFNAIECVESFGEEKRSLRKEEPVEPLLVLLLLRWEVTKPQKPGSVVILPSFVTESESAQKFLQCNRRKRREERKVPPSVSCALY
jgi:hypothetical protein